MDRMRETRMLNSLDRIAVALEKIAGIEPDSPAVDPTPEAPEAVPEKTTKSKKDGDKNE